MAPIGVSQYFNSFEKRHKNLAAHVSPAFGLVKEGDIVTVGQVGDDWVVVVVVVVVVMMIQVATALNTTWLLSRMAG